MWNQRFHTIPPVGRRMEEIVVVVEEGNNDANDDDDEFDFTEPGSRRWRLDEATR